MKNQNGSALLNALMVSLVLGGFAVAIQFWKVRQFELGQNIERSLGADLAMNKVLSAILNDSAWAESYLCYKSDPSCAIAGGVGAPDPSHQIVLLTADKQIFYDSRIPTAGFDPEGNVCNTFNATSGNDACPFRYSVVATGTTAVNVVAKFSAKFKTTKFVLSTMRYDLNLPGRKSAEINPYNFCGKSTATRRATGLPTASLYDGVYDQAEDYCKIRFNRIAICPDGYLMTGLNSDDAGTDAAKCVKTPTLSIPACGTGNMLVGLSPTGNYSCADIPRAD